MQEMEQLKATIARLEQEKLETYVKMEMAQDTATKAATASTVLKRSQPLIGATFGRREPSCEPDPSDSDVPALEFDDEDFDAVAEADERIRRALAKEKAARAKSADRYNLDKLPPLPAAPAKPNKVSIRHMRCIQKLTCLQGGRKKVISGRAAVDEIRDKLSQKRPLSGDESDDER